MGAVKTEFGKFGEMLDKVQNNIRKASDDLLIRGTRTNAIVRKLRTVESLPIEQSSQIVPMLDLDEENEPNLNSF